jgi:hypothetical protein
MKNIYSTLVVAWLGTLVFVMAVLLMVVDDFEERAAAVLDFLGLGAMILGGIVIVAIAAFTTVLLVATVNHHRHRLQRPVDGAFALQRFRRRRWDSTAPVWLALLKWIVGEPVLYNPNLATSAVVVNDWEQGVVEVELAGGWERQLMVRLAVEKTNALRAMYPGDDVRRDRYGAMSDNPRLADGSLKALTDDLKPPALPPGVGPVIEGRAIPVRTSFAQAVAGNTAVEFAVGLDVQTGAVVRWNLERHPHVRFHGTTQGSGKTNLAKHLVIGLLAQGAHVVVLDRRNFKNFGELQGYVECIPTNDPRNFVAAMQRLCAIYQERDRLLGEHGAADITQLARPLPRYGVLLCEFGSLCEVAQAEGLLGQVLQPLSLIMREAAATGVHLLFEDQTTQKGIWPRAVKANAGAVFTGYLPLNEGQAGGYHHAHKLGQYEFHYDGHILKGWDLASEASAVLRTLPRRLRGDLLLGTQGIGPSGHPSIQHNHRSEFDEEADCSSRVFAERSPGVRPEVAGGGALFVNTSDEPGANDAVMKWYGWVQAYMAERPGLWATPPKGIRAMARAMSLAETGSADYEGRYVGVASETCRRIRQAEETEQSVEPINATPADE